MKAKTFQLTWVLLTKKRKLTPAAPPIFQLFLFLCII